MLGWKLEYEGFLKRAVRCLCLSLSTVLSSWITLPLNTSGGHYVTASVWPPLGSFPWLLQLGLFLLCPGLLLRARDTYVGYSA